MQLRQAVRRVDSLGLASLVNIGAALLLFGFFVAASVLAYAFAEDELAESAELFVGHWVETALSNNAAVGRVLGRSLLWQDAPYFRTLSGLGNVARYQIHRPDGSVALDSASFDYGFAATLPPLPPGHPLGAGIVIAHGRAGDGRETTNVIVDHPIRIGSGEVGTVRVVLDQTDTAVLYAAETEASVLLYAVLAGIGLANCLAVGILLRRQRATHARIEHLAHHDPLTGIPNRNVFRADLARLVEGRRPTDRRIALHLIDLDGFKGINDTLGHAGGDALLRIVARALTETVRLGDVVARIGGDEFAVVQREVETVQQALALADRMVQAARSIRELDGTPIGATLSIGIALAPEHAGTVEELQRAADAALYRAKAHGRDQFVVFESGMDEGLRRRNELRLMVRSALERGAFVLHYQPLHTSEGRLCGFEALIRLPDDRGGLVQPGEFIPLAEEMGLTPQLGAWVLDAACRAAAGWPPELTVAVNLSVQQFDDTLCEVVARALAGAGLHPSRLELEITESMFIAEPEQVDATLRELKDLGVRVVMDDFGTGYSSLSYVWKFPFDKLKVDRSCFNALGTSDNVAMVLKTIAMMTEAMDIGLVAEGIETEMQRDFACSAGYDELQGFLYGRPMPEGDLSAYIDGSVVVAHRDRRVHAPLGQALLHDRRHAG